MFTNEHSLYYSSVLKRKAEDGEPDAKRMRIKTEDGELVAVIQDPETGKEIIDLTSDPIDPEEERETTDTAGDGDGQHSSEKENTGNDGSVTEDASSTGDKDKSGDKEHSGDGDNNNDKTSTDVKPDKAELDKQLERNGSENGDDDDHSDETDHTDTDSSTHDATALNSDSTGTTTTTDVKPDVGELNRQMGQNSFKGKPGSKPETYEISARIFSKSVQTVPVDVRPACNDAVKQSSLRPLEQRQQLIGKCGELAECKQNLKSLQDDIYKLLRIIVPDVELGHSTDIQYIIGEMIRVNSEVPADPPSADSAEQS